MVLLRTGSIYSVYILIIMLLQMIHADKIFYEWINANEYTFYLLNFFFSLGVYVYTKNDSMWEDMSFFIVSKGNWSLTGEGQSYMN